MGFLRLLGKIARALIEPWELVMRVRLPSGGKVTVRVPYEAQLPFDQMTSVLAEIRRRLEDAH